MTSISDQFSAVRKAQFDAQFDFFNSITTQALDSAGRVAALNLAVSRDAVQRSLGAGFALAQSRNPRDVFALGSQAEEQMRNLFAYGRELLGIASSLRPPVVRPQALGLASLQANKLAAETVEVLERSVTNAVQAAPAAAAPVAAAAAAVESVAEAAVEPAPAVEAAHPVAAFAPVTEPVVVAEPEAAQEVATQAAAEALAAEPVPVAEPTAIAKAIGKGTARAAAAPHPAAAPVAELAAGERVEAPKLAPAPQVSKRKK